MVVFSLDRAVEVAGFYRDYVAGLADEFSTLLGFFTAPEEEFIPVELRNQPVVGILGCHCGKPADAQRLPDSICALNPAADLFGSMPYTAFQMMFDAGVPAGRRYYFKGGHTTGCPDVMVEAIVEGIRARPSLSSEYHLHHMGGTIARVGAGDTAFADRDAAFTFNIIGNLAS
jgi:hypothetical protein